VSKILVIRGGAIGDFILTLPVLSALRQQFPNVQLEVLGYPHIAQLAVAGGLAEASRSIEARPLANFFARGGVLDPGWQDYFAGVAIIISYLYDPDGIFETNVRHSCKGQFIAGPHRPDESRREHASAVFLEPLKRLAIFDPDPVPRLTLADRERKANVVALHPGSGSERKNWPLENWLQLAQHLLRRENLSLLLVAGEAESSRLEKLTTGLDPTRIEVAFNLPLPTLAQRLASCSRFLGHDSGITHLAAALEVPTLALWGETTEAIWRPLGDHVAIIRSPSGLRNLAVDTVIGAAGF
jgi:heptosyltransferase III